MTDVLWEKAFEFSHPVDAVWRGYLEMQGAPRGEAPVVGLTYTLTDAASSRIEITEVVEDERIGWSEERTGTQMRSVVVFEATASGTRVTITRAGFGEDDDFDVFVESNELGYTESMRDLAVYLATGVAERRHLQDRSATGVVWKQTDAGLVVRKAGAGSLGEQAGLRPGDLLIAIDGAAIYVRSHLWLLARMLEPGTEVDVTFVRDGETLKGRGRMLPIAAAVTGELGLGPRERQDVMS